MSTFVRHRTTCRLCESSNVHKVLDLAPCPPVDAFLEASALPCTQELFPMDLYLCGECGHGQLLDIVSPNLLFGDYIYTTSSSPGLVKYFAQYADEVASYLASKPGDKALDIGSNDGTLLRFFLQKGLSVLGVDPAEELGKQATEYGVRTVCAFFNHATALDLRREWGTANLVTANNVFAHADNLGDMADGVREILAPGGTFVFEVSYLLDMVDKMIFDFIYHEHLSHHSVKPLKRFLAAHGLALTKVVRTPSKGGTIRCFAKHLDEGHPEDSSVQELIDLEETFRLYNLETYNAYSAKIQAVGLELRNLLTKAKEQGKTVAAYGASATGTVLTYHFQLGAFLDFIVDDNKVRQGRFSPGDHIPIVASTALLEKRPDYVVILAWRFSEMIIKANTAYKEVGGTFIVPLPELKVI